MTDFRDNFIHYINEYFGDSDCFFNAIEANVFDDRFDIYCTVGESLGNGTILIFDNETSLFIRWYKLYHLGRDIDTNIKDDITLRIFIEQLYISHSLEEGSLII